MKIYNECLYKMKKALEVELIKFYYDYYWIEDKIKDVFLYLQNGAIIGAVSCYENELDDLIAEKSFQGQGIGQKSLFWGINHIKEKGYEEIILHVAEWNQMKRNCPVWNSVIKSVTELETFPFSTLCGILDMV